MKKYTRSAIGLTLAGLMALSACGGTADVQDPVVDTDTGENTVTAEDIEKRIEKVGRAYDGLDSENDRDGIFGMFSVSNTNGGQYLSAMTQTVTEAACDVEAEVGSVYEPVPGPVVVDQPWSMEGYNETIESGFVNTSTNRFSTFGADVDTATYSNWRRTVFAQYRDFKNDDDGGYSYFTGGLEPGALRVEEMINYFEYSYPEVRDGEKFSVDQAIVPCPWNEDTLLYRVGVRAEEMDISGGSNIVFLVDTSGSMFWNNGLPLAQKALNILQENLTENDTVSIVTYAGSAGVLVEGLSGDRHREIKKAIDSLEAGGGTNGQGGIIKAYEVAEKYFIEGGNNRVILATDGDFNLGTSSEAGLIELIEEKRETGVFLSCLGFGEGNYKDDKMEALADHGNGNYFYIDCTAEAEKALKNEIWSTLYTVAKDTKFQVEFNPDTVKAYRIIGYENRQMAAEDFSNDTKDGGEVGSGQTVTILYEIVPAGSEFGPDAVESRYDNGSEGRVSAGDEYCVLNVRYKEPDGSDSVLRTYPVTVGDLKAEMDLNTSWAAGVAQAGMLYRDSEFAGTSDYDEIIERLSEDPSVMTDDLKAQFLYILGMLSEMS